MKNQVLRNATFGVEILGIDPVALLPRHVDIIKDALWQHGLVLIRGRVLSKAQQIAFSARFGPLEVFPADHLVSKAHPEVYPVSNQADRGYTEVGQYWHADGSFRKEPTELSFFHMVEAASDGGDTAYADMRAAIAQLCPDTQAILGELMSVHGNGRVHPLQRVHPVTERPAIYINLGMVVGLTRPRNPPVGISPDESRRILREIETVLDQDAIQYRHRWQSGDLIIADNRRIAHRAFPAPTHTTRHLHRTTTMPRGSDQ